MRNRIGIATALMGRAAAGAKARLTRERSLLSSLARRVSAMVALTIAVLAFNPAPARATLHLELLTISGGVFGFSPLFPLGSLDGSLSYYFDPATGIASSVASIALVMGPGPTCCDLNRDYYYNAPGHADTTTSVGVGPLLNGSVVVGNLFQFKTESNTRQMYLVVEGSGSAAHVVSVASPPNSGTITCVGKPGDGCYGLMTAATTVAEDLSAPEPASMALFGVGLAGMAIVRRRRAARTAG